MAASVASSFDRVRRHISAVAWGHLVQSSRSFIISLLCRIKVGRLIVLEQGGKGTIFGKTEGADVQPFARLRVVRDAFWLRLALFADMVSNATPNFPRDRDRLSNVFRASQSLSCLGKSSVQT